MARFKYCDISQGLFLSVNLKDQLLPGTFEWTLNYLIDKMDLSFFEQNYHNDQKGAAAYHPKALLKVILYCYSVGILSSRPMEKACQTNIILKALSQDNDPDHATLAAFISTNTQAVKALFIQVLLQCDELDLITGEMFAEDGCKLPSNASKEWSGTIADLKKKRDKLEKLVEKLLVRHQELDKDKEAKKKLRPFKKTMGNDKERRNKHVERIEKKLEKLNEFLRHAQPRIGLGGEEVQSNVTDNQSARIKSSHGYIQGYNGIATADSANQVIICAKAVGSGSESGSFPEMLESLEQNMKIITGKDKPLENSVCLADTGHFSEANLQEAKNKEIDVIIPDPQFRKRDPDFQQRQKAKPKKRYTVEDFKYEEEEDCYQCPAGNRLEYKGEIKLRNNSGSKYQASRGDCGECSHIEKCITIKEQNAKTHVRTLYIVEQRYEENLSQQMRDKIDDPVYREIYSRRQQIIEPTFSDITYCKGMDRFTLRGEEKVDTQWKLFCIVHNIGKCIKPLEKRVKKRKKKREKQERKTI